MPVSFDNIARPRHSPEYSGWRIDNKRIASRPNVVTVESVLIQTSKKTLPGCTATKKIDHKATDVPSSLRFRMNKRNKLITPIAMAIPSTRSAKPLLRGDKSIISRENSGGWRQNQLEKSSVPCERNERMVQRLIASSQIRRCPIHLTLSAMNKMVQSSIVTAMTCLVVKNGFSEPVVMAR